MRHKVKRIHFVGIGGAGMSGIAEVLMNLDFEVSGSDLAQNSATERLASFGATVQLGHSPENIGNADVVVISTAVAADNPEVLAAREKKIPVVPRAMMLAELMRFRQGIAVAGTHGKTTTTSLIASVLAEAGMDPTFVIGGRLTSSGSHARLGKGEFLVAEADESDASFLYLQPIIAVVTNIDEDHMETYDHDFAKLKEAFTNFLHHIPFYGLAVLCIDDANVAELRPQVTKPVMTYGLDEGADLRAVDVGHQDGQMRFRVERKPLRPGEVAPPDLDITLNLPGLHNVRNALAAIAIGYELAVPDDAIVKALREFKGVGRRFQRYGEIVLNGKRCTLVDDYGHHPVEMAATLAAVRGAFPQKRLVLVFQPHRYTRTRDLFEDFVKILSTTDVLLLTEVYAAGEVPIVAADSRSLARAIRVQGKVEPIFVDTAAALPAAVVSVINDGDIILTMGAGSIGQLPQQLMESQNS